MSAPLLEVTGLTKDFASGGGLLGGPRRVVRAVDDVSFQVAERETLGIVGESGSGKTTLGKLVLGLVPATSGSVRFGGRELLTMSPGAMRAIRRELQVIFQDPSSALNPRMTVGEAVAEPLRVHGLASHADVGDAVLALFRRVGLGAEHLARYPHELSGGQKQRVVIARALSLRPRFVVCDEPVAALDVSVQAQVVNLLRDLSDELGLSYLFVAHDLSVVRLVSDRIAVMYLGRIVELAETEALHAEPLHPYTRALLSAVPSMDRGAAKRHRAGPERRLVLEGEPPSPSDPATRIGCGFAPRCPIAEKGLCEVQRPALRELERDGVTRRVACHLV
ncbi:MAG: ATP-binding cassette domain-containing protein [Sandaracinaceae bacterium]|nr:ATP-binding cassette domain-containing protein [Sandaracinaceae bacterium]